MLWLPLVYLNSCTLKISCHIHVSSEVLVSTNIGFLLKFDNCADLVVPAQPIYVPRLKVLFPALPPLFRFHGDIKFSKSSVSALQDKMVPHPSCQPLFSATVCLIPECHILSSLKVLHMHEFVVFPCRLISCFSLPVDKWYLRRSVLTINQSLNFCSRFSSFFFSVPALMSFRHGLVEGQQSYCLLRAFSFFSNFDMPLDLLTFSDTFGSALRFEC